MNVYDFDDTIFRGDSTRAFWAYCLKRAPGLARFLPRQCAAAVRYALGRTAKEAFKEAFFSFLHQSSGSLRCCPVDRIRHAFG